jgi:hypothetical protein
VTYGGQRRRERFNPLPPPFRAPAASAVSARKNGIAKRNIVVYNPSWKFMNADVFVKEVAAVG